MRGSELKDSTKEEELKAEGLTKTIWVSKKGKERTMNVERVSILRI
jgi:hypothetical protein